VNLTGAALLGVERSQLLQRRLPRFLPVTSLPIFRAFLERVFTGTAPQLCEAPLLKADGAKFWANFHGSRAAAAAGLPQWCRVAVSDITPLKEAEEAQHQVEALTASNLELQQEIVRRQTVEASFQTSQQQQAQLLAESREMHEQMRHLSHQILQAQEDERKRISRELHDDITQTLVGINVHLTALAQEATVNPATLKQKIVQTQRLVEKSVEMVHQFARELRPTSLDDLGLIATLHSFMKDFLKRTGIRVQFTTFAEVDQVDSARRTVIYRVVQSALANVAQHARASRVKVSLCKLADGVHLEITDNGRAFQVDRVLKAKKYKRLGLLGMRERVEMVGGKLAIESTRGQGTTIRAQIPFGEFLPPRPALMEPAKGKP